MKANKEYKNLIEWLKKHNYNEIFYPNEINVITDVWEIVSNYPGIKNKKLSKEVVNELNDLLTKLKEGKIIVVEEYPSDEEIEDLVNTIAYGQLAEEQSDDYLEKIWKVKVFINKYFKELTK